MQLLDTRALPRAQSAVVLPRLRLLPLLALIAAVCLVSVFYVWSRLEVTRHEYAIASLEGRLRALSREHQALSLEVESLKSPARIGQLARRDLGLQMPDPDQIVIVRR